MTTSNEIKVSRGLLAALFEVDPRSIPRWINEGLKGHPEHLLDDGCRLREYTVHDFWEVVDFMDKRNRWQELARKSGGIRTGQEHREYIIGKLFGWIACIRDHARGGQEVERFRMLN
jgi:hypothetical protein